MFTNFFSRKFHILLQMCLPAKCGSCWLNIAPPCPLPLRTFLVLLVLFFLFYRVGNTNTACRWLYWSCVLFFVGLSLPECDRHEGRCLCFFCWLMCPSHLQHHFFPPQITCLVLLLFFLWNDTVLQWVWDKSSSVSGKTETEMLTLTSFLLWPS